MGVHLLQPRLLVDETRLCLINTQSALWANLANRSESEEQSLARNLTEDISRVISHVTCLRF